MSIRRRPSVRPRRAIIKPIERRASQQCRIDAHRLLVGRCSRLLQQHLSVATSAADGAASRVTGRQSQRSTVSSAKFAHAENDTGHVSSSNPTRPNPSHRPIVSPNPLMTIGNPQSTRDGATHGDVIEPNVTMDGPTNVHLYAHKFTHT